jgi:hypothetical protein
LEDDDLADDVRCAKRIKRAHDRVTGGNGFTAWAVYRQHCSGPQEALEKKFTADCFANSKVTTSSSTTTTTTIETSSQDLPATSSATTGTISQETLASSRLTWPSYYYMTHSTHPQYWYLSTPLNSLHQPYVLG